MLFFKATEIFKQSVNYSGPVIWNNLPDCIKNLETVDSFHRHCIKWMKSSVYLSIFETEALCPYEHNFECKIVNMFCSYFGAQKICLIETHLLSTKSKCLKIGINIKKLFSRGTISIIFMYIKCACRFESAPCCLYYFVYM